MVRYFFVVLFLFLSSCTNSSKVDQSILDELSCINYTGNIESIPRYEFSSRFNQLTYTSSCNNKKYDLEVNFIENNNNSITLKEAETIRENIELIVEYRLLKGDKVIYSGKLREISSYNTMFSPYSSSVESEVTVKNLYIYAAEELRRRLILFFMHEFSRSDI